MLWLFVSNAAVRLIAIQIVRCGGFFCFKHVATSLVSCSRVEVVECPVLDPCCSKAGSRCVLTVISMRVSITLTAGQSSKIDLYELTKEESLPGL